MPNFELIAQFEDIPEALHTQADIVEQAIVSRVNELHEELASRISENLTGGVLKERTGQLEETIRVQPAVVGPEVVEAQTSAGGPEAPYGIFHEFGGINYYIIRPINAKALAFEMGGGTVFARQVVHPPLPQRSWFNSEIEEMLPKMQAEIAEAAFNWG